MDSWEHFFPNRLPLGSFFTEKLRLPQVDYPAISLQDLTILLTEFFCWYKIHIPSIINLLTKSPIEFIPSVIPLVKMTRHNFFLLCFNFFSHGNSLGIYRGNISISKISRKFTDGNIPSIFPFVFIDFLIVFIVLNFNCFLRDPRLPSNSFYLQYSSNIFALQLK